MIENTKFGSVAVGGTGMLAKATRWLADRHPATLVAARRASRFAGADPRCVSLDADWHTLAFRAGVVAALQRQAPVSRALLWLHEPGPILAWLAPLLPMESTVLVLGSLDEAPPCPLGAEKMAIVRLGDKPTPAGGRRWLTHEEISDAAIAALSDGRSRVVGDLPLAAPTRPEDVFGRLAHDGPPISLEEMDAAVMDETRRRDAGD